MIAPPNKKLNVKALLLVLAVIAVGAIALGVPWTTILVVALALCCPLMMLFMGHGGHGGGASR